MHASQQRRGLFRVQKSSLSNMVHDWVKQKLKKLEENALPSLPEFLRVKPKKVKEFFERAKRYYIDMLELETFFASNHNSELLELLASVGINDIIKADVDLLKERNSFLKTSAEIVIVDELTSGAHAELRLFKYLDKNGRLNNKEPIPYFGITMLCCANCHLFLKAHGIDYVEGHRCRAGTHAKHYPDWVFKPEEFSEDSLRRFLGEKVFDLYEKLEGSLTCGQVTQSKCAWFFSIIEELGKLTEEDLQQFNFNSHKIFAVGSLFSENTIYDNQKDSHEKRALLEKIDKDKHDLCFSFFSHEERELLIEYRHENEDIQHAYDCNFGLIAF